MNNPPNQPAVENSAQLLGAASRRVVGVFLDADFGARDRVLLAAILQLFNRSHPVDVAVVLDRVEQVEQHHADALASVCLELVGPDAPLPELWLVTRAELDELRPVMLATAEDEGAVARSVVLLGAFARSVWDELDGTAKRREAEAANGARFAKRIARLEIQLARSMATVAQAKHDLRRTQMGDDSKVHVAVVLQHQPTWGAVETLCEALRERTDVQLDLVAFESRHDGQKGTTADFILAQGYPPRSPEWLRASLPDIDVLVTDSPYDDLKPEGLRTTDLLAAGVRTAYVPYGNNVGDGPRIKQMQYDQPLHRMAWRVFARSQRQRQMYAAYCAAGNEHVRVLGLPKLDRVARASSPSEAESVRMVAGNRPVFLWNPHFTTGPGGWSTFYDYLGPILDHFGRHQERFLLLRPHFRILRDLTVQGGEAAASARNFRETLARMPNVLLDESPDYKVAFAAADAMLSDVSSLVTEFLPTGKPLLYLHRADGPGVNEDAAYFDDLYRADDWAGVERFLDMVAAGEDPMFERRHAAVKDSFGVLDGRAGQRIAEEIVTAVLAERGSVPNIRATEGAA